MATTNEIKIILVKIGKPVLFGQLMNQYLIFFLKKTKKNDNHLHC